MNGSEVRQRIVAQARRIVVKVGTNAICDRGGRPDLSAIRALARQIAAVREAGVSVTLVASGAIGAGLGEMALDRRPKNMPQLQAVAAVGQGQLMRIFHDIFARHGVKVAQVLVTRDDFTDRTRYLNIRNTLTALDEFRSLPIINENDTVAVDEIRFGNNDILAALVTNLLAADLLVFLTSVGGLIDGKEIVPVVREVNGEVLSMVRDDRSPLGTGGMGSKLEAAAMVTRAGELAVIASSREDDVLRRLLAGEEIGTVFVPARRKMSSRRRWIGQASRPAGRVVVDAGAARALIERGKSLLPSGVTAVAGRFAKGAVVSVVGVDGNEIARGLTNYSAAQLDRIKGLKTTQIARVLGDKPYDEVIHRNNLTLR